MIHRQFVARRGQIAAFGAVLRVCCMLVAGGAAAQTAPQANSGAWPQATSDIPADSDIRFGALPNGMRFAIMRNATPPGATSLRLRIGAGSLQERDDQRGLAHFLEHMAFKGSTHVPPGEMLKILERKGLAFGPDSNAFTQFDQTFFKLDLPGSDDDRVDTGLMLLREVASELSLTQSAMDGERGVVLSEERLRDTPARALGKWQREFIFEGQRVATRDPIGAVDVIQTAPVSLIREFYDAYYRPENATLIAVGDFDPAVMEAKIRARFSDWRGRGPPGPRPDLGQPMARGETFRMLIRPEIPGLYGVTWAQPFDAAPDTRATERRRLIDDIGLVILNQRLARLAEGPGAPFLSASFSRSNLLHTARLTSLSMISAPHTLDRAVAAAIAEQRRIVEFGVTDSELTEILANLRAAGAAGAAAAATRSTHALADGLLASANGDTVFKSPRQSAALIDETANTLTSSEVNAALKGTFAGSGPLIAAAFPSVLPEGAAGLKADYDNAIAAPLTNAASPTAKIWPYDDFGPAGRLVWRSYVADLGVTQTRFANGLRLNVKTTTFAKDEILIAAKLGDGVIGLTANNPAPLWLVNALALGGTQELTTDDIRVSLAGVVAGVAFTVSDAGFGLGSATRPKDFVRDLQLITALIARPGLRPEAVERLKASIGVELPSLETTPEGVLGRTLPLLLHRGDARWRATPNGAELAKTTPGDLAVLIGPVLKSGALELSIVGDISADQAIAAVAQTLGTLPPRDDPRPVPDGNRTVLPPEGTPTPTVVTHTGRADQAIAYVEWPTADFNADQHRARILELTAKVLENRIIERVRNDEAATYTPNATSVASSDLLGFGFVAASVEIPPQKIDAFFGDIDNIITDMGVRPPTADEFERARAPAIETALKARETNGFWLGLLNGSQADPRRFATARTRIADLRSATPDDVRRVAAQFLQPARGWKLIVRARSAATQPTPTAAAPAP